MPPFPITLLLLQRVWKWAVVPLLGALLLFQYSVLLGLPPSLRPMLTNLLGQQQARGALGLPEEVEVSCDACIHQPCCSAWLLLCSECFLMCLRTHTVLLPAMQEWLGLGTVDPIALWLLFLSFSSSVLQVHYINWMRCAQQQRLQQPQREEPQQQEPWAQEQGRLSRGSSFDGIESPRAGVSAPLLANPQQSQQEQHTTLQITASVQDLEAIPAAALAGSSDDNTSSLLWQPMALAAQGQWHWQDWGRYFIYRWAS